MASTVGAVDAVANRGGTIGTQSAQRAVLGPQRPGHGRNRHAVCNPSAPREQLRRHRRRSRAMPSLTPAQREFLDNPYVGTVTTLRADGSPHSTVVWVEQQDGALSFNTARGRAKD